MSNEPVRYKDSPYLIYQDGRVYSEITKKYLKPGKCKKYDSFTLCWGGIRTQITRHRLIAICYIPNPDNKRLVRHLNDNVADNSLSNLAWGTNHDNMQDALRNGSPIGDNKSKGILHPKAKLTEEQVYEIRRRYDDRERCIDIAPIFGVRPDQICNIGRRKQWKHLPENIKP